MKKLLFALILALFIPLSASASFDVNVKYGTARSDKVREIQEFLTDQGVYTGPITGNFFALTRAGVRNFQRTNGVRITGSWDTATRNKANELLALDEVDEPGVNTAPTNLSLIRFPDGSVYDSNGTMVTPPSVTPAPVVDVCANIEGNQSTTPSGMTRDGNGNCSLPAPQPMAH